MSVRSLGPVVRFTLVGAVAAVALACGSSTPDATSASAATASEQPSAAVACNVETPPGPADAATVPGPGGDAMDFTDLGAGRLRLCLLEPVPFLVEGSAWCTWTEDRSAVIEASGVPFKVGAGPTNVGGAVNIQRGGASVSSDGFQVSHAWDGGPDGVGLRAAADGRSGTVTFRLPEIVDQEHPPAVRPPDAVGVMSWLCGEPPVPG